MDSWSKLSTRCARSTDLADLVDDHPDAFILFTYMLAAGRAWGRFSADPRKLKAAVCPIPERLTRKVISDAVIVLVEKGMLTVYQDENGDDCLAITNYHKENPTHNWSRCSGSDYPPPPDWQPPASLLVYLAKVNAGLYMGKDKQPLVLDDECARLRVEKPSHSDLECVAKPENEMKTSHSDLGETESPSHCDLGGQVTLGTHSERGHQRSIREQLTSTTTTGAGADAPAALPPVDGKAKKRRATEPDDDLTDRLKAIQPAWTQTKRGKYRALVLRAAKDPAQHKRFGTTDAGTITRLVLDALEACPPEDATYPDRGFGDAMRTYDAVHGRAGPVVGRGGRMPPAANHPPAGPITI